MIEFAKVINLLLDNVLLDELLSGRTYNLILPEGCQLPCVVFEREGDALQSKDGKGISNVNLTVNVLAETYSQSIEVANIINSILNGFSGLIGATRVHNINIQSVSEDFINDTFIQILNYNAKIS